MTVDGVMQGLGGSEEDRRGDFDRGGWAISLVDDATIQYLDEIYSSAAAFLFFAGSWGAFDDPSTSAIASALGRPRKVDLASP